MQPADPSFKQFINGESVRYSKLLALALILPFALSLAACSSASKNLESRLPGGGKNKQQALAVAGLAVDQQGQIKTVQDILFQPKSSKLREEAAYVVTDAVQYLLKHRRKTATIKGHTDAYGTEEENLNLSIQRAFAVRNAMIAAGIPAFRLEPLGVGEMRPVASNETEKGRTANRRVEIIFPD